MRSTATKAPEARPCVWMTAGLLSYRLCDRDFDCEHCPLDAALRGVPPRRDAVGPPHAAVSFPGDRRYGRGHTWVLNGGAEAAEGSEAREGTSPCGHVARVGLDGLAVALLGAPRGVRLGPVGESLHEGDALCEVDLEAGWLSVRSPLDGYLVRGNPVLDDAPASLVSEPYGAGWLAEVALDGEPPDLVDVDRAWERARLDLRHFRRRAALEMLAGEAELGPTLPDGGELVSDLPGLLGPQRYLELLRELLE